MDTNIGGIKAPAQKLGGIGTASLLPRSEQQILASRVLGGGDGRRFGVGGGAGFGGRFAGEGRGNRAYGDESELGRKILATHHEAEERLHVMPILQVIDVIFYRATADLPGFIQGQENFSRSVMEMFLPRIVLMKSVNEIWDCVDFFNELCNRVHKRSPTLLQPTKRPCALPLLSKTRLNFQQG